MSLDYQSPTSGPSGDGDADDTAAMQLWQAEASDGTWSPECWHKTPEQLIEEARSDNLAAFAGSMRYAGQHSNPPAPPSYLRPF